MIYQRAHFKNARPKKGPPNFGLGGNNQTSPRARPNGPGKKGKNQKKKRVFDFTPKKLYYKGSFFDLGKEKYSRFLIIFINIPCFFFIREQIKTIIFIFLNTKITRGAGGNPYL